MDFNAPARMKRRDAIRRAQQKEAEERELYDKRDFIADALRAAKLNEDTPKAVPGSKSTIEYLKDTMGRDRERYLDLSSKTKKKLAKKSATGGDCELTANELTDLVICEYNNLTQVDMAGYLNIIPVSFTYKPVDLLGAKLGVDYACKKAKKTIYIKMAPSKERYDTIFPFYLDVQSSIYLTPKLTQIERDRVGGKKREKNIYGFRLRARPVNITNSKELVSEIELALQNITDWMDNLWYEDERLSDEKRYSLETFVSFIINERIVGQHIVIGDSEDFGLALPDKKKTTKK